MYSLSLKHGQPSGFINHLASQQKIRLHENTLVIKAGIAPGVFKAFTLENNVHCLCAAYNPREDFYLHKMPLHQEFFVLRIDEIQATNMSNTGNYEKRQSVLLLSTLEDFTLTLILFCLPVFCRGLLPISSTLRPCLARCVGLSSGQVDRKSVV